MNPFGLLLSAVIASLVAVCPAMAGPAAHAPTPVIFDTDMYGDIDDVLALAMLHALQDRGEARIAAITIGTELKSIAPYVDLIDTFYGHGDIPIGVVRGGVTPRRFDEKPFSSFPKPYSPNGLHYTQYIAQRANPDGSPVYPHRLTDGTRTEEAVHLLRRVLAAARDDSVVMIQIGYSTNFARLLDSKADGISPLSGRDLIRRKVRLLSAMAGNFGPSEIAGHGFPAGSPEFNLMADVPAAQRLFAEWPTRIVTSGFEVGARILYPLRATDSDFGYVAHHPIADTFTYVAPWFQRAFGDPKMPYAHPTFDLTAVLYAVRPDSGYFALSPPGTIKVLDDGGSTFVPAPDGQRQFLILADSERARVLEAMSLLISQPPAHRKAFRER